MKREGNDMNKIVKTFAQANGLTVSGNTAYGSLRGYTAAVTHGKEHIVISLSTFFPSAAVLAAFKEDLYQKSITREYRVLDLKFHPSTIVITLSFHAASDINRIEAFMNYFFPLLRTHDALRSDYCTECCKELANGSWELINGKAYHLHKDCAEKLHERLHIDVQPNNNSFITTLQSFFGKRTGRYQSN